MVAAALVSVKRSILAVIEGWQLGAKFNYAHNRKRNYFTIFPPGTILPIGDDGNVGSTSTLCAPLPCFVEFTDGLLGNPGSDDNIGKLELNALATGNHNHTVRIAVGIERYEINANATQNFGPGIIDGTVSPIDGTLTDVTNNPDATYILDAQRMVKYLSLQDEWALHPKWVLITGVR